jgi:hypothetical protein
MSHQIPDYFQIEKFVYSKGCLDTGINVFQIKSDFHEKFEKEIYDSSFSNGEIEKYDYTQFRPWQKTPIDTIKLQDVAKAWGTISSTGKCLDKNSYKEIFLKSLRGDAYFTTNSGLLLVYNYEEHFLFISNWD